MRSNLVKMEQNGLFGIRRSMNLLDLILHILWIWTLRDLNPRPSPNSALVTLLGGIL